MVAYYVHVLYKPLYLEVTNKIKRCLLCAVLACTSAPKQYNKFVPQKFYLEVAISGQTKLYRLFNVKSRSVTIT